MKLFGRDVFGFRKIEKVKTVSILKILGIPLLLSEESGFIVNIIDNDGNIETSLSVSSLVIQAG